MSARRQRSLLVFKGGAAIAARTVNDRAMVAAILASGATYRSLGEALDLSPSAARMRARRAGLRSLHRCRPRNSETPRRMQVARRMLAGGCDIEDIAERLSMPAGAVRMMLRRASA